MAGSYINSILKFLRNCQNVFHSDCTSLHSDHHWIMVPFSAQPRQRLWLLVLLITAIPTSVRWCFIAVLICIKCPNIKWIVCSVLPAVNVTTTTTFQMYFHYSKNSVCPLSLSHFPILPSAPILASRNY